MIGIVGGIGPMAGADLYKKIVENTDAVIDQEHLPVVLASFPNEIADRTAYIFGKSSESPAPGLARVVMMLEQMGASCIGIACNTAHAPMIYNEMEQILLHNASKANIAHLINLTVADILAHARGIRKVGLLCTLGSYKARLYQAPLEAAGLEPVLLPIDRHKVLVHDPIYDVDHGLKIHSDGHPEAVYKLNTAISELQELGAEAIVLGCTEIGMVEHCLDFMDLSPFNPNTILARHLISSTFPEKLKQRADA